MWDKHNYRKQSEQSRKFTGKKVTIKQTLVTYPRHHLAAISAH
jgi:hypothetical protein